MKENELVALERIAHSSSRLVQALLGNHGTVSTTLVHVKEDLELLAKAREPEPVPTAKEIIEKALEANIFPFFYDKEGFGKKLVGDIHQALVEAGYL